jgi:hypothetical protein
VRGCIAHLEEIEPGRFVRDPSSTVGGLDRRARGGEIARWILKLQQCLDGLSAQLEGELEALDGAVDRQWSVCGNRQCFIQSRQRALEIV